MSEMSILASGERQDPGILWPAECKRHALKISRTTGAPVVTLGGLTRPRNSGSHTFSSMRSLISREALRLTSLRLLVPQGPTFSYLAIDRSLKKISSQLRVFVPPLQFLFRDNNSIIRNSQIQRLGDSRYEINSLRKNNWSIIIRIKSIIKMLRTTSLI